MSAKAVREYHGKKLLAKYLQDIGGLEVEDRAALITSTTNYKELELAEPWLLTNTNKSIHTNSDGTAIASRLVVKPNQLIKRRGKAGLVGINLTWSEVQDWIRARMHQVIQVEHATGTLDHFIVEPFVPHQVESEEYYVCIQSEREGEEVLFYHEGGVDVGDVDAKARKVFVRLIDAEFSAQSFIQQA